VETRSSRALAARRRTYELSRFARANTGLSGTGCCPPAPCRHGTRRYPAGGQPVRLSLGGVVRPTLGSRRLRRRSDVACIGTQGMGNVRAALMPDGSAIAPASLRWGVVPYADGRTRLRRIIGTCGRE
jgi:hypothetical protein